MAMMLISSDSVVRGGYDIYFNDIMCKNNIFGILFKLKVSDFS